MDSDWNNVFVVNIEIWESKEVARLLPCVLNLVPCRNPSYRLWLGEWVRLIRIWIICIIEIFLWGFCSSKDVSDGLLAIMSNNFEYTIINAWTYNKYARLLHAINPFLDIQNNKTWPQHKASFHEISHASTSWKQRHNEGIIVFTSLAHVTGRERRKILPSKEERF